MFNVPSIPIQKSFFLFFLLQVIPNCLLSFPPPLFAPLFLPLSLSRSVTACSAWKPIQQTRSTVYVSAWRTTLTSSFSFTGGSLSFRILSRYDTQMHTFRSLSSFICSQRGISEHMETWECIYLCTPSSQMPRERHTLPTLYCQYDETRTVHGFIISGFVSGSQAR